MQALGTGVSACTERKYLSVYIVEETGIEKPAEN